MIDDLTRIIVAGAAGALAMAFTSYIFHAMGLPMVDFGRLIATKILRYHSHGTQLGLALHVANGVLLALLYALVVARWLPGGPWQRGALYGALLWLIMMVVVLPVLGDGLFGMRTSRSMVPSALVVHLLYGLIVGLSVRW